MAFSEKLKLKVKRLACFRCCVCNAIGIEIHHIIPECEDGPDTEENAAPLCPNCHELYGANQQKRKFITEIRDHWYSQCAITSSNDYLRKLDNVASKDDVFSIIEKVKDEIRSSLQSRKKGRPRPRGHRLPELLMNLHSYRPKGRKVSDKAINFLHFFIWGGKVAEEYDEVKSKFVELFGQLTAKKICEYVLSTHDYDIMKDGFTEEEMDKLCTLVFISMTMLLHHEDVYVGKEKLAVEFNNGFWARAKDVRNSTRALRRNDAT